MQAKNEKRPVDGFPAKQVWRNGHGTTQGTAAARERERTSSLGPLGFDIGQIDPERSCSGKLLSPSRRRACIELVRGKVKISQRRVCHVLGQQRSTQRRVPRGCADEKRLVADTIELTHQYDRYGYQRVAALLRYLEAA